MIQLPFELPKSLSSYAEQFEQDPEKTISRLKAQLQKRGPDAVGHFLLAWFYHLRDNNDKAIEYSLKAKTFAPGSPFFEKLHYYLSHPHIFDAWVPDTGFAIPKNTSGTYKKISGPTLDLDNLIERLAKVESEKIKTSDDEAKESETYVSKFHEDVDDIVSETLATIHESQGKTDAAIRAYKRLKKLNKEKQSFYSEKISRLREIQKEEEEKNRERSD